MENQKEVYQLDQKGFLVGVTQADLLEDGTWQIPGCCVEDKPPTAVKKGFILRYKDGLWSEVENLLGKIYYTGQQEFSVNDLDFILPEGSSWDKPLPPEPTPQEILKSRTNLVQSYLDSSVQSKGYDNILSACTYATSTVPKFQVEGQAAVEFRDAVWSKCYEIFDEVQAGTRGIPTEQELIQELPTLDW